MERTLGYHSSIAAVLTGRRETGFGTVSGGQFDWGGRSKSNEAPKGSLRMVGNHPMSAKA